MSANLDLEINFDSSVKNFLSNVKNRGNIYDKEMVDHHFKMTNTVLIISAMSYCVYVRPLPVVHQIPFVTKLFITISVDLDFLTRFLSRSELLVLQSRP